MITSKHEAAIRSRDSVANHQWRNFDVTSTEPLSCASVGINRLVVYSSTFDSIFFKSLLKRPTTTMNKIRQIQELNKKELEQGISPNASWHTDYRDTAFVYFGGLPFELSEGDVITIFSQYGEPVFLKLARDKETGKSRGFGWLKYEDQRSTDLAVDNLGGASIGGRLISVDHARYTSRDDEDDDEFKIGWEDMQRREGGLGSDTDMGDATPSEDEGRKHKSSQKRIREHEEPPELPEERQLQKLIDEHDDEDPMKNFLIEEKKKEVDEARRLRDETGSSHRHRSSRSHRSHRSRRDEEDRDKDKERGKYRERSSRHRSDRDRSDRDVDRETRKDHDRARDKDKERDRDGDKDRPREDRGKDDDRDRERRREREREKNGHGERGSERDRGKDRHRNRDYDEKSRRRNREDRDRRH